MESIAQRLLATLSSDGRLMSTVVQDTTCPAHIHGAIYQVLCTLVLVPALCMPARCIRISPKDSLSWLLRGAAEPRLPGLRCPACGDIHARRRRGLRVEGKESLRQSSRANWAGTGQKWQPLDNRSAPGPCSDLACVSSARGASPASPYFICATVPRLTVENGLHRRATRA